MDRVLLVEDSEEMRRLVEHALRQDFHLSGCASLRTARERLAREVPDLVLLDLSLPDGEGLELCSELKNRPEARDVPVVILTGRTTPRDKVTAFGLGADDYVDKPFHPDELRARVAARIRKLRASRDGEEVISRGPLRIDRARFHAFLREGESERELQLTPHEFRLLAHLAAREGRVASRGQLLEVIAPGAVVGERTVDTHLSNLRRKLGAQRGCLEAVRGVGYRFLCPPGEVRES